MCASAGGSSGRAGLVVGESREEKREKEGLAGMARAGNTFRCIVQPSCASKTVTEVS